MAFKTEAKSEESVMFVFSTNWRFWQWCHISRRRLWQSHMAA